MNDEEVRLALALSNHHLRLILAWMATVYQGNIHATAATN